MKTIAYIRVSTDQQELDSQRLAIHEYAHTKGLHVDQFVEVQVSSRKSTKERLLDELLETFQPGDTLLVAELSRLGRSLGQVVQLVDELVKRKIKFVAIKENIILAGDGQQDMQSKVMVALFALFAEIERDLISQRTKQGLAATRAKGVKLGRPPGPGRSKLDGREKEIQNLLALKVGKASIAKICGVSRSTLCSFIESRDLQSDEA